MTEQPSWLGPALRSEAEPRSIPPLRLVLEDSDHRITISESGLTLGRHSEADIRLAVSDVSRKHCRFLFRDGNWIVLDLNSLNGTYVNEEPVHQSELRSGDVLRIAGFRFRVELGVELNESDLAGRIFRITPRHHGGPELRRAG